MSNILRSLIPCRSVYTHNFFVLKDSDALNSDFSLLGGAESLAQGKPTLDGRSPRRTFAAVERERNASVYPAPPQDPKDFLWLMTEEPHRTRRMAIMKAHPEVRVDVAFRVVTRFLTLHSHR